MRDNFNVHEWNIKRIREENKGRDTAREFISKMRDVMRSLSDDELDTFRKDIAQAFDLNMNESVNEVSSKEKEIYAKIEKLRVLSNSGKITGDQFLDKFYPLARQLKGMKESVNEDEGTLNKIADMLSRKFDNLRFDVNTMSDRIDVRGSQQDLANFGDKLHGKKIFDYEVFATDDDDRGEIVRIVKSDSISRG